MVDVSHRVVSDYQDKRFIEFCTSKEGKLVLAVNKSCRGNIKVHYESFIKTL